MGQEGASDYVREQDRLLPIANISRIMKGTLPGSAKVAQGAKDSVQEYASEFIALITAEAAERAIENNRKTITGEDILCALSALGFEEITPALKIQLSAFMAPK